MCCPSGGGRCTGRTPTDDKRAMRQRTFIRASCFLTARIPFVATYAGSQLLEHHPHHSCHSQMVDSAVQNSCAPSYAGTGYSYDLA